MDNQKPRLPIKEIVAMRNKKIKDLYKLGYSFEEIAKIVNVSKTTIFFAIRGRKKSNKN